MKFDFENYRGEYVSVPVPLFKEVKDFVEVFNATLKNNLQECLTYEPYITPKERYTRAWREYVDSVDVVRVDGDTLCPVCRRPYRVHLQPLKDENPTIRISCEGWAVKL